MVATYTAHNLLAMCECRIVLHDPAAAATAQLVDLGQPQGAGNKCLPIAVFRKFKVGVSAAVLTGAGVTAFSIYGATAADGTGGVAVVTHAVGTAPDAVGDTLWLECNAEQIREVLSTATHVGVWLDCAHDDDKITVFFERADPLYGPRAGLTADYTAA